MTMHAITIQQPWAEAIARHGKNVENRTRRPPAHLIGQRVAIHVGKTWGVNLSGIALPAETIQFAREHCRSEGGRLLAPPNAGHIIATARLVGWRTVDRFCPGEGHVDGVMTEAARRSPWFTGLVGWVLADVRPLTVPVGSTGTVDCRRCHGFCCKDSDGDRVTHATMLRYPDDARHDCSCENGDGPIRGQLYPFALSADVEAAILQQEGKC